MRAAIAGDLGESRRLAEQLRESGLGLEYLGRALICASRHGRVEVAQLLLLRGAAVDHKTPVGHTALMLASMEGHERVCSCLLSAGANIFEKARGGWSSLLLSALHGRVGTADLLLSRGAPVNDTSHDGYSSLMVASQNGHADVVDLLLSRGADVGCMKEVKEQSPRSAAHESEHIAIASRLVKWPMTMAIVAFQELGLYYEVHSSLVDLWQYLGGGDEDEDEYEE